MLNTALDRGGAARMAKTLALAEARLGVDVTLYHAQDSDIARPFHGLKRPFSRHVNALLWRIGGATRQYDMGVAAEFVKFASDADVIHLHNVHGYYLDIGELFAKLTNPPIVWTWHDMWPVTGRCSNATNCEGWYRGCVCCPHKDYYPAAWIDNARSEYILKSQIFADLANLWVVSPSQWLRKIALQRGFDPASTLVIPNPVDLAAYRACDKREARRELGLNLEGGCLLFVAADCDDRRKGYADFAEVVQRGGWRGLVVGKPPANRINAFHYAGPIHDPARLSLYYSAADAFVITSYADNYPNTVIEALACGTDVVGYATGGIADQVPNPELTIAAVGNRDDLLDKLRCLMSHDSSSSGQSLRDYAQRAWAPAFIAAEYISIYEKAMSARA